MRVISIGKRPLRAVAWGLGPVAVLALASALIYRGLNAVRIKPVSEAQIAGLIGTDLMPRTPAPMPVLPEAEITDLANDPLTRKTISLLSDRRIKLTDYQREIRGSWRITEALAGNFSGARARVPDDPILGGSLNAALRDLARLYQGQIRLEAALKDGNRCFRACAGALAYEEFVERSATSGLVRILTASAIDVIIQGSIAEAAQSKTLSADELAEIAGKMKAAPVRDDSFAEAVRCEFANNAVPFCRKIQRGPNEIADNILLSDFMGSSHPDLRPYIVGELDVPATLRLLADLSREEIANLSRPWSMQERSVEAALGREVGRLPEFPTDDPALPWYRRLWQKVSFKARLRGVPNGLGLEAFRTWGMIGLADSSFSRRTTHEAKRLIVLIELYRATHGGALPRGLEDLKAVAPDVASPIDFYGGAPFRYSRVRRIIWSVGKNGVDDGGVGTSRPYAGPDLVWQIP